MTSEPHGLVLLSNPSAPGCRYLLEQPSASGDSPESLCWCLKPMMFC